MGEHHNDTTNNASPAVSLSKTTSDEDLSSYIGGSLSPSFKAKVMISTNAADEHIESCDMGMEGVEEEVTSLAVQSTLSQAAAVASTSTCFPSESMSTEALREQAPITDTTATAPSTTTDPLTPPLTEEGEKMKGVDQSIEPVTPASGQDEGVEQDNNDEDSSDDDNEGHDGGSQGLDEEPSMVSTTDAIYSAVPISSELHIFPHSSKGFNWNQDLFLKPHQRRNLGVDELHSAFNASVGGLASSGSSSNSDSSSMSNSSSSHHGGMSAVRVHEIRLDQLETDQILPSH
ncbi:hypothetical protein BGZ95_007506 [Linnemannia exigua]|uniref:Uncharacterized protein n=1 Tax=Linnemannia exigua TaxID=604196 RepID=A0AAD4H876_9FUNG|nr:hypothetical protein BGZ95_007506 [Linnemannia exigua]